MPRPPILPATPWSEIFEIAKSYTDWLKAAESNDNRRQIEQNYANLKLAPQRVAYLKALPARIKILAFAEDWCGDVIRHVPVLQALADLSSNIEVKYLARAEAAETFARFLTNGGEAIPKFIFLNQDLIEFANWGPMPESCRKLIAQGKARGDVATARKSVAAMYEIDSNKNEVVSELLSLIELASS